jgi:hypothetical protein
VAVTDTPTLAWLVFRGFGYLDIAYHCRIRPSTVRKMLSIVLEKTGCQCRTQLAMWMARQSGIGEISRKGGRMTEKNMKKKLRRMPAGVNADMARCKRGKRGKRR